MEIVPYQPKTRDYDIVVEQFNAEYKLDVKRLKELKDIICNAITEKARDEAMREWYHLWPEYDESIYKIEDLTEDTIPKTVLKKTYFRQSEKDKRTLPINHYSLQEIILTDLQNERNRNKKLKAMAEEAHDVDSAKRFDAMQLALKVVSNSIYGASNNAVFAHYDPDIAATITWNARCCIRQLTHNLQSDTFYVDDEFLDDPYVKEHLEKIEPLKVVRIQEIKKEDYKKIPRRDSLRRLFTDIYDIDESKKIYKITKEPCVVVYQDTDSNYFECPYVQQHFLGIRPHDANYDLSKFRCEPKLINQMMNVMVSYDLFLCQVVAKIIDRNPIGLGFEGSFIVCRYLNRKKKYYGVKAADEEGNVFTDKLSDEAYDENGVLKTNFDDYWTPKYKCIPQSTGEYIKIDDVKLLQQRVNYLDYILSMGVKVTGVDLTRRDQYKFINYCHVLVLQKDLRLCRFDTATRQWVGIDPGEKIESTVNAIIEEVRLAFNQFVKIANFDTDMKPRFNFTIQDFTKNARYDPSTSNDVKYIINRYEKEIKEYEEELEGLDAEDEDMKEEYQEAEENIKRIKSYIPYVGSRLFYVICANERTDAQTRKGVKSLVDLKDLRKSVDELYYEIENYYRKRGISSKAYYEKHAPANWTITYEEWLNAVCISKLYFKHYLSALAKALSLYVFGEKFADVAKQIDDNQYSDTEKKAIVDKYQEIIAQEIIDRYYPRNRVTRTNVETLDKRRFTKKELDIEDDELTELIGKTLKEWKEPTITDKNKGQLKSLIEFCKDSTKHELDAVDNVRIYTGTDRFSEPPYKKTSKEFSVWQDANRQKDGYKYLENKHNSLKETYANCVKILKILKTRKLD